MVRTKIETIEPQRRDQMLRDRQPGDPSVAALATIVDRALLWLPAADAEPMTIADIICADVLARNARRRAMLSGRA